MKKLLYLIFLLPVLAFGQQQTINIGSTANDGTGDPLRTAFTKTNANFTELYAGVVSYGSTTGTDNYLASVYPVPVSYFTGKKFSVIFGNANTTTATINVNNLGVKTLKKNVTDNLEAGDIIAGSSHIIMYDGTNFQVLTLGSAGNFVPYSGATGNVTLGEYEIAAGQVEFDQTPTGTAGVGVLRWNDTDGTLEFGMKGGNVTQQIGQENPIMVRNSSGGTLNNGQVVYISGSTGTHMIVSLAQAGALATTETTIGILTEDILDNASGFATTFGLVRDINTSALTEGEPVYLSSSTPGALTSTEPSSFYSVRVGICVRSHVTQGVIFVHPDKSYENELNAKADLSDLTTRNNLPAEYQVNDYSLVPGDTSRLLVLKDALTTLTIGNFATGVDGSQFVIYNETGATVTIDPSTYITKGPLEILDTTYAYIHFAADTFRISTAKAASGSGTVNSGTQYRLGYYATTGTAISEAGAITASRALKSDANGVPTHFDTATEPSLTELTYVKGVTSAIQTQLNAKANVNQELSSVSTSTAGATITLDMNSLVQRIHVGSATFATPKTIAISNSTNALVFSFHFEITNIAAALTLPSGWLMSDALFSSNVWTPVSTGKYEMGGIYDGTNWKIKIMGPFN